jgi:hypothetical protein
VDEAKESDVSDVPVTSRFDRRAKRAQDKINREADLSQRKAKEAECKAYREADRAARAERQAATEAERAERKATREAKGAKPKTSCKADRQVYCAEVKAERKAGRVKAEFVTDANLPDGTVVPAGVPFLKKWSIKNHGAVEWPVQTVLLDVTAKPHTPVQDFAVPLARPGETVEVAVNVNQVAAGRVKRVYRLEAEGRRFGPRMWVDVTAAP